MITKRQLSSGAETAPVLPSSAESFSVSAGRPARSNSGIRVKKEAAA